MRTAFLLLLVSTLAHARDCQPDYAECQGKKGYVTNTADWHFLAPSWTLVQRMKGYAVFAHPSASFRVIVNERSVSEDFGDRARPGWSLQRSLMLPGHADPLCVMYDQTVHMTLQNGFPVDLRAYWAGECPKELRK